MNKLSIAVGLIVLVAVGVYLYTTKPPAVHEEASTMNIYHVEEVGIRFEYPKAYTLTSRDELYEGKEAHILTMVNASTTVPDMSEGPIAMSIVEVPVATSTNVEAWVREHSISNFNLSPDKVLTPTTVAGVPALAYRHSGLYEFDAVAFQNNGHLYIVSVSWLTQGDAIRQDFKDLLASVTFIK